MKKLYRGPYIDIFCQVWFHLAQLFQRSRLKYEKVNGRTTDDGRRMYDGRQVMAISHMTRSGELESGNALPGMRRTYFQ
jgi:hypothetical protein